MTIITRHEGAESSTIWVMWGGLAPGGTAGVPKLRTGVALRYAAEMTVAPQERGATHAASSIRVAVFSMQRTLSNPLSRSGLIFGRGETQGLGEAEDEGGAPGELRGLGILEEHVGGNGARSDEGADAGADGTGDDSADHRTGADG